MAIAINQTAGAVRFDLCMEAERRAQKAFRSRAVFCLLDEPDGEGWDFCPARPLIFASDWRPRVGEPMIALDDADGGGGGGVCERDARIAYFQELPRRPEDNGPVMGIFLTRCALH